MYSSTLAVLRAIRKLLPSVAARPAFQLCDTIWAFGYCRCMQISSAEQFYAFRADFVGDLIPRYKQAFSRYTTVEVRRSPTEQ